MVNQKPTDDTLTFMYYANIGTYYYGVFTANGTTGSMPVYDVIYNYAGNPKADAIAKDNRLLKRQDNSDGQEWQNTGAILNALSTTLSTRGGTRDTYHGEYIMCQRPNSASNLPGPGYALNIGAQGNWASININRPDSTYTVAFWLRKTNDGDIVTFKSPLSQPPIFCFGDAYSRNFLENGWGDPTGAWSPYYTNKDGWEWVHVAFVKKNETVTLYVNGMIAPENVVYHVPQNTDYDMITMVIGNDNSDYPKSFTGMVDEFQLWDIALDSITIRNWMCRKITSQNPYEAQHLLAYFQFDEGSGTQLENPCGPGILQLSGSNIGFVESGAAVGDTSTCIYPAITNDHISPVNLSISDPDGDYLSYSNVSKVTYGVQLYRVNGRAQFSTIPGGIVTIDSTRYWGVYPLDSSFWGGMVQNTYTVKYNNIQDDKNVNLANEADLRLLNRLNNAAAAWNLNAAAPAANTFTDSYSIPNSGPTNGDGMPEEFVMGATQPNTIVVNTSVPAKPGAISGSALVCSGAEGLIYSVAKVTGATSYVWTLGNGLSGYSDSTEIVVAVSPTASGSLGNITVSAVNSYGSGPSNSLAITAQSVPDLSVNITGPVEVCSKQSATYSIPAVAGASAYTWQITPDGTITANNSTSINVTFGTQSGIIAVTGTFSCGTSIINTEPVTVNAAPLTNLTILSGSACKGPDTAGTFTIVNSQAGVQYQAYKNNGTSPVGSPVTGTGQNLTVSIPLNNLLAGDNSITVKAQTAGCTTVTMSQVPVITVYIAPAVNMPISYSPTVCPGDSAYISFPTGMPGMIVNTQITCTWRIDDETNPKAVPASGVALGSNHEIALPPSPYNQQTSGAGINLGQNTIKFTVENGTCPTVTLDTTAVITVPNSPHILSYNSGMQWWIYTGSPWVAKPPFVLGDSINISTPMDPNNQHQTICQSDTLTYYITKAQAGVSYYAQIEFNYNNDIPSVIGPVVSNVVTPTVNGQEVIIKVPAYSMEISRSGNGNDWDAIEVIASLNGCTPVLGYYKYQVVAGPDTGLEIIGSTVCVGANGTVLVDNAQNNVNYDLYQGTTEVKRYLETDQT